MPLKLITGPANAAKAGEVLGAFRSRAEAGDAPILVVPTASDRDSYERELLAGGSLVGGRVLTWEALVGLLARRHGIGLRLIGPLRRRTLVRKAIDAASDDLECLLGSSTTVGFTTSLESTFREVGRAGLDSRRLAELVERSADPRRIELARLLASYEAVLGSEGVTDRERQALAVLESLERESGLWDERPVLVYGFSELTVVQRRALTALSLQCDVVVSLPADGRDRVGLAEHTVRAFARHFPGGVPVESLPAAREPRGPGLLESRLFSGAAKGAARGASGTVRVLVGNGTTAAAELVAKEVASRVSEGVAVEDLVIVKPPRMPAEPIVAALRERGLDSSWQRSVVLGATALGSSLVGLLRCELDRDRAEAADAVAWIASTSDATGIAVAEEIDRGMRVDGDRRAGRLLAEWVSRREAEPEFSGSVAGAKTASAMAGAIKTVARDLFARLASGDGRPLRLDQAEQAAALTAVTVGAADVAELFDSGSPQAMIDELAALPVELSDGLARPGAVLISDALSIRGRSFDTVIVCGLEDGLFPSSFSPDPFLEDAAAEGLALEDERISASEVHSGAEREQFVICAARARERLVLVRRGVDDNGGELPRSPFLDEAMRLLGREFDDFDERRRSGLVDGEAGDRGAARLEALTGRASSHPSAPAQLGADAASAVAGDLGSVASPTRLERYTECPARWLADVVLNPLDFDERPEHMELGNVVHDALEHGIGVVIERDLGPVSEANREVIVDAFEEALAAAAATLGSTVSARLRIEQARRLLHLWLDLEIERADGWTPKEVEFEFGASDEVEPLDLGNGLTVTGKIDRVDVAVTDEGEELVVIRDYKSGRSHGRPKKPESAKVNSGNRAAKFWNDEHRPVFQAPLYLLAASRELDLPAGGAFYETLKDSQRRGGLLSDLSADPSFKSLLGREELEELLAASVKQAMEVVQAMVDGRVPPTDNCDCPHPWLCGRRP